MVALEWKIWREKLTHMGTSRFSKEYLETIIDALVAQGEDAGELGIWKHLFDALSDVGKRELIENLENELKELK